VLPFLLTKKESTTEESGSLAKKRDESSILRSQELHNLGCSINIASIGDDNSVTFTFNDPNGVMTDSDRESYRATAEYTVSSRLGKTPKSSALTSNGCIVYY